MTVSPERHRRIAQIFLASPQRDTSGELDEVVRSDVRTSRPFPTQEPGLAGLKKILAEAREAFPDLRWHEISSKLEGNWQTHEFTSSGTHKKNFIGVPALGKSIALPGTLILEVDDSGMVGSLEFKMDLAVLVAQMQGQS